jgi:hypothetical protein
MKRQNRKDLSKTTPTIIDTPQGKLITSYTDKLTGQDEGPFLIMDVHQFLRSLREQQEENEVAE